MMMAYNIKKHIVGGVEKQQQGVSSTAEEAKCSLNINPSFHSALHNFAGCMAPLNKRSMLFKHIRQTSTAQPMGQ